MSVSGKNNIIVKNQPLLGFRLFKKKIGVAESSAITDPSELCPLGVLEIR